MSTQVDHKFRRKTSQKPKRGAAPPTGDIDTDVRDIAGLRVILHPPTGSTVDEEAALCYRVLRRLATRCPGEKPPCSTVSDALSFPAFPSFGP